LSPSTVAIQGTVDFCNIEISFHITRKPDPRATPDVVFAAGGQGLTGYTWHVGKTATNRPEE
jgi:hypothetical protein